ncbi:MAG: GDP-mannose dehydrogenase, partial [Pseudomonadota bacterium]
PGLVKLAGDLKGLLAETAADAVDRVDAVIVTQKHPVYAGLAQIAADNFNKPVIDVVRIFDEMPSAPAYMGIGW